MLLYRLSLLLSLIAHPQQTLISFDLVFPLVQQYLFPLLHHFTHFVVFLLDPRLLFCEIADSVPHFLYVFVDSGETLFFMAELILNDI